MKKTAYILIICMALSIVPVHMSAAAATMVDSCTALDGDGKECYGIILGNDTTVSTELEDQNGFRAESTEAGSYVKYFPGGDLKSFTVEASYYKRKGTFGDDLTFEVSSDDSTYTSVSVTRTGNTVDEAADSTWSKIVWTADNLPEGSKYLRILFGSTYAPGKNWVVHMSKVEIKYEADGELPSEPNYYSFEADFETQSELDIGWSKFLGSQNEMENIIGLSTDVFYSGSASLVLENLGADTRSVTCYRNLDIRKADDVINSSVMVYIPEDVVFNNGWVRYTIKPQVGTEKSIMIDISVYEDRIVSDIDGTVTTTDYPGGTTGQWLLLETGDFIYPQDTSLAEVSLECLNGFEGKVYFDTYRYKSFDAEAMTFGEPLVFRENAEGLPVPFDKDTEAYAAGNKLMTEFTATNLTGSDKDIYAMLVVYSSSGRMLDVGYERITVSSTAREESETVTVTLADETEGIYTGATVKVFIWDAGTLRPIGTALSVTRTV